MPNDTTQFDALLQKYGNTPAAPEATPEAAPKQESLAKRAGRRAVQEVLSAGGAPQGLYGLGRAAWEASTSDDVDFATAMFSEEGRQVMEAAQSGDMTAILRGKHDTKSLLRPGLSSALDWYDWGGDVAGVTDNPDGTVPLDEEAGGLAMSTLLTLPLAPSKLVTIPAKGAVMGARGAAMAAKGALTGLEVVTPVTLGGKKAVAANMVVQSGINDATRAIMDEPTLTGTVALGTDDYTTGSITPTAGLPVDDTPVQDAGIIGGAAGVLAAGLAGGSRLRNTTSKLANSAGNLGQMPARSVSEAVTDIGNAIGDESGILVEGVKRTAGQESADSFNDLLRATTGQATGATLKRFNDGGLLEHDGSLRTIPMRALVRNYRKLGANKAVFDDTMLALDELNNRARNLSTSSEPINVLQMKVTRGLRDPQVKALVEQYDKITRDFTTLRNKRGVIDNAQMAEEMARAFDSKAGTGGYVPVIESPTVDNMPTRVRNFLTPGGEKSKATGPVSFERMRQANNNIKRVPPIEALQQYTATQLEELGKIAARRSFLKQVANAPVESFPDGRKLVEKGENGPGIPITIPDKGEPRVYRVGDPRIAVALQFRPHASIPVATTMRRWYQRGTTGALNPMFAPVSLTYDALFGMLAARNDKIVTGIFDQSLAVAAKKMGMPDNVALRMRQALSGVTRPAELTFTVLEGLIEGATGRYKMLQAERLMQEAARFGTPVTAKAADEAATTFLRSKYGLMHQSGYAAHNHLDDVIETENVMGRISGSLPVQVYTNLLETLRDAYRMGIYSRNVSAAKHASNKPLTSADYNKIARHTKEVAADPTRRGASETLNKITSTMPYANVIMHSTAHLAAQFNNPAAYSVLGAVVAARVALYNSMSPEAREYIDRRVPEYKRISYLPIEQKPADGEAFDPQKHVEWIPLSPELGTMSRMAEQLFYGAADQEAENNMDKSLSMSLRTAVGDLFSFAVPPALNVLAAGSDHGSIQPGAALDDRELFRQPFSDGGMPEFRGTNLNAGAVNDKAHNMIYSALGTAGRTIMDAAEIMDSQMNRYGDDFYEAADKAFDVTMYNAVERQPVGTLFTDTVIKGPLSAQIGERAYEIDRQMQRIGDMSRAITPIISEMWDADIPLGDALDNMPKTLEGSPELWAESRRVSIYFAKPAHKEQMNRIGQLRKQYRRIQGNTDITVEAQNTMLNSIANQMFDRYENVLSGYGEFEEMMITSTGNPNWSLDNFVDRAEAYLLR